MVLTCQVWFVEVCAVFAALLCLPKCRRVANRSCALVPCREELSSAGHRGASEPSDPTCGKVIRRTHSPALPFRALHSRAGTRPRIPCILADALCRPTTVRRNVYRKQIMKSYPSSQSGQGSRRGPRNRGEGRGGRNFERRSGVPKPAPKSFWQKITGFFKGLFAPAPAKHDATSAPARAATESRSNDGGSNGRSRDSSAPRAARKPEAVDVTSPRLYVGNLSFDATESDLTDLFKGVGQVVAVEVVSHRQTQRSKGFAFVQMQTVDEAKRAVQELHDKEFMSRKLVVSGAKNLDQQDGRSEPRFAA